MNEEETVMKRLLSILLTLSLLMTMCVLTASAEGEELTTIRILGHENGTDNLFVEHAESQLNWQIMSEMFTEAGLKLEFEVIPDTEQYKTTIQTRLAAAHDLPELFYSGYTDEADLIDLADMGIVIKMNDVLAATKGDAYNFYYGGMGDQARQLISDAEGNFYWLPRIQINQLYGTNAGTCMATAIRLDWLNQLNLEVPNSLESYAAALKAFQENDMNGNGVVDEFAVEDTSRFSTGMNLWFGIPTCDSTGIGINLTEKRVESAWYNPNIKAYFEYVQSLVADGLLYQDAIGSDTSTSALKSNNQVAAKPYYSLGTYEEATMVSAGHKDAYLLTIYPFDAVEGTKAFYSEETPYLVYLRFSVSNSAADKLEAVSRLFDVTYSEKFLEMSRWGIEGKNYEVLEDGSRHSLTSGMTTQEKVEKGIAGANIKFLLPTLTLNERSGEMSRTIEAGWQKKVDFELSTADYQPRTPNDNTGYYALGTAEENEILSTYTTDLSTASREIAANLSLGVYSVDDIDTYIEELRGVGLDEVLAVRQAQYARAQGFQSYEALEANATLK